MAFPKIRINLATAQAIFYDSQIAEHIDDTGIVLNYSGGARDGRTLVDRALWKLCKQLREADPQAFRRSPQEGEGGANQKS